MKSETWEYFICSIRKNKRLVIALVGTAVLACLTPLATPLIYRGIIDQSILENDVISLLMYILALIGIPIAATFLGNLQNIFAVQLSDKLVRNLRQKLLSHALQMETCEIEKIGIQKILFNITRGCGRLSDVFLCGDIMIMLRSGLTLLGTFVIMFTMNWQMAVLSLMIFPATLYTMKRVKDRVKVVDGALLKVLQSGEALLREILDGIHTVKVFRGNRRELDRFSVWQDQHYTVKLSSNKMHEFERVLLPNFIGQILYGLVYLICVLLVQKQSLTIGGLIAFVAYIPPAFSAVRDFLGIQVGFGSIKPLIAEFDTILGARLEEGSLNPGRQELSPIITFENVGFSYAQAGFTIRNMNLSIYKDEFVGIVGRSGCGKSTIIDLLLRVYTPTSGMIRVNGCNITESSPEALRSLFAVVPQDVFLWDTTAIDNITYPNTSYDMADVEEVIDLSSSRVIIENHKETSVGERGGRLSGGERQRIGIARALMQKSATIYLLDELTSALDALTEGSISEFFRSLHGKRTIIAISHHIRTILHADRVFVMDNGVVIAEGTPATLYRENELFRELCNAQGINL